MTVTIEKIVPGGDGMGRAEGKVVFVPLTLPGEVHRIRIVQEKKGFIKGESEELLERAGTAVPRREPFCPHYGSCGGCNLQHMAYGEQLKAKSRMAMDSLSRLGGSEVVSSLPEKWEILPSREKAYRNRAQFHRRGDSLGFRSRRSHDLIPLKECPLLVKGINDFLSSHNIGDLPSKERFTLFGTDDICRVEGMHNLVETDLLGKRVRFSPALFFQSNLSLFPELLKDILAFAGEGETFMDLYSGVGVFAMFLEDKFASGTAVESSPGALEFARDNLRTTDFFEEPVEKWSRKNTRGSLDFLVVDPPRTGLSRTARETVINLRPRKFSYVSCDPVTQSRDLKDLLEGGFGMVDYKLYDFYPQTSHMEGVAHLEWLG